MPLWYKLCEKMHVHEDKNAETDMLSEMMYAICGNDIEAAWNIAIEAIAKVEKLEKDQQE
jgi:hypothetical protein